MAAEQRIRERGDPAAMHAAALIELLDGGGGERSLQQAISRLSSAALQSPQPAPILADLSAAYLLRGDVRHTPRDWVAAIEAAERSLQHSPRDRAARYNLALALQRFGLVDRTIQAWREYLSADSSSLWAARACANVAALREVRAPVAPAADAPDSTYAAFAQADPQAARELGFGRELGGWGNAQLRGDSAGARAHLAHATAMGLALARRAGGDHSLLDAVHAIERLKPNERSTLARAHQSYAEGSAQYDRVQFDSAASSFAAAVDHSATSRSLHGWARLQQGSMLFLGGQAPLGEQIAQEIIRTADPLRTPVLVGRARLAVGTVRLRGDRYESGQALVRESAELFRATGEGVNRGIALNALAIIASALGDDDEAYGLLHAALDRLRPYRDSYRLHNSLGFAAELAVRDGFPRAAAQLQDEDVAIASRTGNPEFLAEARLIRGRLRAAVRDTEAAEQDLDATTGQIERVTATSSHKWLIAQRQLIRGALLRDRAPLLAAEQFDSASNFYLAIRDPMLAFSAVLDGAGARLQGGQRQRAQTGLESAMAMLEHRRDSIGLEPRRAAVFERARGVVDRVAMLKLAAGDSLQAFSVLDRGRASLAQTGGRSRVGRVSVYASPAGEVVLDYNMVGDTLLTWLITGDRPQLSRSVIDTLNLFQSIDLLLEKLETGADNNGVQSLLSALHRQLLGPVARQLGPAGTPLVVIVDGALAAIPFAALFDEQSGRYLVEDHPIRFAVSLREAHRQTLRNHPSRVPLFVVDPAYDRASKTGFQRLPGAAAEVVDIAAAYPHREILAGREATPEALSAEMRRTGLLHYAGHAVFDDERPERSYLLLARGSVGETLTARDIAEMDLKNLSLVVLSACETVRSGRGRAAGFSGLSGAFLAAGVGGSVGSLWAVDDRLTRPLMVELHRALQTSPNAASALQIAQQRLLRSANPALRSPAAWAGFRYVGG